MANTNEALNKAREALEEAINFIEWIEILGREGVEIYKHELRGNAEMFRGRIEPALAALTAASAEAATPVNIEGPFGLALNVQHKDCHKAANAFWDYWRENGETHKHGYYESTWGAINQAIKLIGVVPWTYGGTIPACAAPQASQPIGQHSSMDYGGGPFVGVDERPEDVVSSSQPVSGAMTDEEIKECIDQVGFSQMVTADDVFYLIARAIEKHFLSASGQAVSDDTPIAIPGDIVHLMPSETVSGKRVNRDDAWLVTSEYLRVRNEQAVSEKAVRDAVLEEAAKACWNPPDGYRSAWDRGLGDYAEGQEAAHKACAESIRALASTPAQQTEAPAITDDLRLLRQKAFAFDEWIEKTNWVQDQLSTFPPPNSLGLHRADVMRNEIKLLRAVVGEAQTAPANVPNPISVLRKAMDDAGMIGEVRARLVGHFTNQWNAVLPAAPAPVQTEAQQSEKDANHE